MDFAHDTQQDVFIINYKDLNDKTGFIKAQIKTIFYLTSPKKDFSSEHEKQEFANMWLLPYLEHFPEYTYVSIDKNNVVSGYLTGCPNTDSSTDFLKFSYLDKFKHLYKNYPAHFHINIHPKLQGQGLGKQLIQQFESHLQNKKIQGAHIITHPNALNINFYKKTGYKNTEANMPNYFFMGKRF